MSASRMGSRGNRRSDQRFQTDGDISRVSQSGERMLKDWVGPGTDGMANLTLEATNDGKRWNQFSANKQKFGIEPTYEERFYTTEIDRSHPEYAARAQAAAQVAREIEIAAAAAGGTSGAHYAEEHGLSHDDDGIDEEDMFSGVVHTGKQTPGWNADKAAAFAATEAANAIADPDYLAKQEASERRADEQKLASSQAASSTKAAPAAKPDSGSDAGSESGSATTSDTATSPSEKSKKKFNFAASAAKGSSFRASFSPSPGHRFATPDKPHSPGQMHQGFVPPGGPQFAPFPGPGMPGVMPGQMPYGGMMPPPNMPMGFAPPSPFGPPGLSDMFSGDKPGPVDVSKVKPLKATDFDFMATLKEKGEPTPRIYFTAPTYAGSSTETIEQQFPKQNHMAAMPMFAPPMGFMMPQY